MKKALSILLLAVLISCSRSENYNVIKLHDISKNEDCQIIPLDSIVASTEVIELDNSEKAPIIGVISSLYESEWSFYVVSDSKFVYEYDKTGKYIRQIGTQGRGPGEYLSVEGISANSKDSSVNLFDFPSQRLLKYDREGNYLSFFEPKFKDPLLYLSSFYPYKDSLLFYTANNSSRTDLFLFSNLGGDMDVISKKERSMLPGEIILGNINIFGDNQNPYIYNYFNDTIFTLKNKKLIPTLLARIGNLRIDYDNLFIEKMGNSGNSIFQMGNIIKGGDYVLFFYNISAILERTRTPFLSLYNVTTNSYTQNVQIKDNTESLLTIGSRDKMFHGLSAKDMLVIKSLPDSDENPIIIKFRVK
ncbi:MAG: 6-bladed beta-propeller [Bacteroidales bacterium]|nr:6-bladed beta-propeller [Bacteroidales bacterium]